MHFQALKKLQELFTLKDTKTGPLSLSLHERAETWKEAYEALKKEVKAENISVPAFAGNAGKKPPYFFTGMQENERTRQG